MNKKLNTDKPGMKWKWSYRIIDGSYRVHTRLYKLHSTIVHTERTIFDLLKTMLISNNIVITALFFLIVLYIQIKKIELTPEYYPTLSVIISLLVLGWGYQFFQGKKIKKRLLEMSSEITEESLEKWPDYLWDEASKWATRILMTTEILKEIEKISSCERDDEYTTTKTNFFSILKESIDGLKDIKNTCKKGPKPKRHDYDKTIQICNKFIEKGEEFIEKGERV